MAPACAGVAAFAALVVRADSGLIAYWLRFPAAFDSGSLRALALHCGVPAVLAGALCLAAWGLGERALGAGRGEPERVAAALALGIGLWANAFLGLGLAGLLRPVPVAILAAALLAAGWPALRAVGARRPRPSRPGWVAGIGGAILAYALWHALIHALAPVSDHDALVSHLALPKLYLADGRIGEIPWLFMSHYPHLLSVLYALPLMMRQETAASLLHAAAGVALGWTMFRVVRAELDRPTAWASVAIMAVQPLTGESAGAARPELWWALFHFLAYVSAWRWKRGLQPAWLVRAGLFAGLAAATKLWGLLALGILGSWVFLQQEGSTFRRAKAAVTVLGCGVVSLAPWWLKTWLGTGNPVWPYLSGVFGDRWGAAYFAERISLAQGWPGWALHEPAFLLRQGPQYVLLPLAVVASWVWARRRGEGSWPPFLRFQLLCFIPYAAVMLWNLNVWRYCVEWLPALSIVLAWGCVSLARRGPAARVAAAALLATALSPVLALTQNNELFAVLELSSASQPGRRPREIYRERTIQPYAFLLAVNRRFAAPGQPPAKILLVHVTRGYTLDVAYQWGHPYQQGLVRYDELADGRALGQRLDELRITHVAVADRPEDHYEPNARVERLVAELLRDRGRLELREGPYRLFGI